MKKKKLIISLIKDNLINTRLMLGLKDIGLNDFIYYHLNLSETILELMKVEVKENQYEKYLSLFDQIKYINIVEHPEQLDGVAEIIYHKIIEKYSKNNRV